MRDLPFEISYGLYKDRSIEDIVIIVIASMVARNIATIEGDRLEFTATSIPHPLKKFFKHLKIGSSNTISEVHIEDLVEYLYEVLQSNRMIRTYPIIGLVKTKQYKRFIRTNIYSVQRDIARFIQSGNKECLAAIDERIAKTTLVFQPTDGFYSYYRDNADALANAVNAYFGVVNLERYHYYYTKSGYRKKID